MCDGESTTLGAASNKDVTMTSTPVVTSSHDTTEHESPLSPTSALGPAPTTGAIESSASTTQALGLGKLAEEVPFSHHVNSTIVCRITGKIMDEDNWPLAFPDGNVYSVEVCQVLLEVLSSLSSAIQAMQDMAAKNNNLVTCPRTGNTCSFAELRKVFIS